MVGLVHRKKDGIFFCYCNIFYRFSYVDSAVVIAGAADFAPELFLLLAVVSAVPVYFDYPKTYPFIFEIVDVRDYPYQS